MTTNKYFNKKKLPEKGFLENLDDIFEDLKDSDPEYYLDDLDYILANLGMSLHRGNERFDEYFINVLEEIALTSMERGHYALTGFDKIDYICYGNLSQTFKDGFLQNMSHNMRENEDFIINAIEHLSVNELNDVVKNFNYQQIKKFLEMSEDYEINFQNIDTALNHLWQYQESITIEDIDDLMKVMAEINKQPSDYFIMENFDDDIRKQIKIIYEEKSFSNNLKYF